MSETIKKMIRSKFDKEIEIPNISLENINKALKEMDKITNEMLNPFDSVFDKMVKDIRDRQDNVIAMEFTKCIGELLRKNGVVLKMTEYTRNFETDKTFETRYGVSIDELDFSEHDKVFEDKIAELEKQIERVMREKQLAYDRSEQLMKTADILNSANKELKQRIAELESKETEKPTKINLNDRIKVKLTPLGAEIYYHQYDELNKRIKENGETELEPIMPQIDKDRYTKFQLWHFMELYGEHIGMCKPNVIIPLDIIIVE